MQTLNQIDIARKFIKKHEGLRLTEYDDTTGHNTIGYGWNLASKSLPEGIGHIVNGKLTITQSEADKLLDKSMLLHWANLNLELPWVSTLNNWRQAVLLDMAFNMGVPTLLTFKNTLSLIKYGDYDGASRLMLQSTWAKQVKRRADILSETMRRGVLAQAMMPQYQLNGECNN